MKKILVVEDDYILALVQTKFLQKMGFDVVAAVTTGEGAIAAVKEFSPDIIVMDVRIDGPLDGVQTMLLIKEFSGVPVIYLSGNSEMAMLERSKETNTKGFLVKPVNYKELEAILRSV
ncbi:MAG: domain S-box [Bacteroidetes bacterium]|nr:domain S-box [Bacteroidota bacterium]